MSGFEIAGIVLGAFSVPADAIEDFQGLYQKTKRWWSFGIAFEDFLLSLDTERVAFLQNLDNLLSSLDISETEKQSLMEDPKSLLWHDPHVQAQLQRRLTTSYFGWYISVLTDILEAMEEINELLPVGKEYKIDAKNFENLLFKAKTSFSSHKDRLLQRIQHRNEEISEFLLRESLQQKTSSTNAGRGLGNTSMQSRP